MGVQGFPTLKIVTPGPKLGRPSVEDYRGSRTAKGMVDAVVEKIPNHVKRLQDRDLQTWLATNNDTAKAVLFSEKGTTSPLTRALAIDFLGLVSVAQVRSKEDTAVQLFGISKFPTLILLPGGQREPKIYEGEMKKGAMASFLRQAITSGEADSQSVRVIIIRRRARTAYQASFLGNFTKARHSCRSPSCHEARSYCSCPCADNI